MRSMTIEHEPKRSHKSKSHLTTPAPPMIAPDAPRDHGIGRRCGRCNARVNRYTSLGVGEKKPTCFSCRQKRIDEDLADALLQAELTGASFDTKLHSLKACRLERAMSQRQLAKAVGTNPAYISQLERGVNGSGELLSGRLAEALGVTVEELREVS